jgi:hypothetical protein
MPTVPSPPLRWWPGAVLTGCWGQVSVARSGVDSPSTMPVGGACCGARSSRRDLGPVGRGDGGSAGMQRQCISAPSTVSSVGRGLVHGGRDTAQWPIPTSRRAALPLEGGAVRAAYGAMVGLAARTLHPIQLIPSAELAHAAVWHEGDEGRPVSLLPLCVVPHSAGSGEPAPPCP